MAGVLYSQRIVIWQSSWKHKLAYKYEFSAESLSYGIEICDQEGYWNTSRTSGVARITYVGSMFQDKIYSVTFRDWETNSTEGMMYSPHAFSWQVQVTGDTEFLIYDDENYHHTNIRPPVEYFATVHDLIGYLAKGKKVRVRQRAFDDQAGSYIKSTTLHAIEPINIGWARSIRVQTPTGAFSVGDGCIPLRTISTDQNLFRAESDLTEDKSAQYPLFATRWDTEKVTKNGNNLS